jgi:D-tyrosyl-tRNA(Tyr) deacylase
MKVVIQNVLNANILINNNEIAKIDRGFVILVGFTFGDNKDTVLKMVNKILNLRVFPDINGKTNLSLIDIKGDILSISQFTLYANTNDGRRPSFVDALTPSLASELYDFFNLSLEKAYKPIQKGVFGADMKVSLINDGPFTIILDSEKLK